MKSLIAELHRRNVFRAGLAYLATSWLLTEVCGTLFPAFGVPDWIFRLLVMLLVSGLPVALVVSWIYELTPEGFMREVDVAPHQSIRHLTGRRLDFVVMGALLVVVAWLLYDRDPASEVMTPHSVADAGTAPVSIAVLPFLNMSDDKANAYFSDGIAEELLNALTEINELRVVGRHSSFAFRGGQDDLRSIGEQLRTDNILAGSVRKVGDQVRISAQLINARTGFQLWSETYNRHLDDIFQVQENIAGAIISALQVRLLAGQVPSHVSTRNAEAYDFYLRAREIQRTASMPDDQDRAIALFDQALHTDPGFVEAMAGKCRAYTAQYGNSNDTGTFQRASVTCGQAAKMDQTNVETRLALGQLSVMTGRLAAAIEEFDAVVRLQPGDDSAYVGLGDAQAAGGDLDAASTSFQRAIDLRPDNAQNRSHFGVALYQGGFFQAAQDQFQAALKLEPDDASLYSNLGAVQFYLGRFTEAAESFRQSINRQPTADAYSNAGANYYYAANYAAAAKMFDKAVEMSPSDFRLHGNVGDACRRIDDSDARCRIHYQKAVALADEHLVVNPGDADAIALKAMYLECLGNSDSARANIQRAQGMAPESYEVQWAAAITWNRMHEFQRASLALQAALDNGYPRLALQADPDLNNLTANGLLLSMASVDKG